MGFFENYEKEQTENLAADLLQNITYTSQDTGSIDIQALFNVSIEKGENYVEQIGRIGVFTQDVDPRTGDTFTDEQGRSWYIEGFIQQKNDMIFMRCYANSEARYE